jgi:thermitase
MSSIIRSAGGKDLRPIGHLGMYEIRVASSRLSSALSYLRTAGSVELVEREGIALPMDTIPNDPYFPTGPGSQLGGEWGSYTTHAPAAWDLSTGSSSAVVAVIDSGIASGHPDLAGRLVAGYNVLDGTSNTDDTYGHGTEVAGVIAAATNNATGVAGYCWNCLLMPVKVYTDANGGTYANLATGMQWAVDHGARVLNISLGGTVQSSVLDDAVAYARNAGAVVIVAAGNSGCNCPTYPADSPGAIAVAASDQNDTLYSYSNFGSWVDVAAPGQNLTTWLTDPFTGQQYGYAPVGGTSMAAPVVAGIAGLLYSLVPKATGSQVEGWLSTTTSPVQGANSVGDGRVDAYNALLAAGGQPLPSPSPSPSPSSSPSPSPSPLPSPSPSPSQTPSPSPTPTPTPTPGLVTSTFNGAINTKNTSRTYSLAIGAGTANASLSFSKCGSLTLQLNDSIGNTVGTASGPSIVALFATVGAGSYTYVVSGVGKCNFSLTVTAPK